MTHRTDHIVLHAQVPLILLLGMLASAGLLLMPGADVRVGLASGGDPRPMGTKAGASPIGGGTCVPRWSVVPSPNSGSVNNKLMAVAVVTTTNVWAVGEANGQTLIERWDGSSWAISTAPNVGVLYGVDGISPGDAWAVGENGILHWNGLSWSVSSSYCGRAIDALALNDVWAVGCGIVHWDGTHWNVVLAQDTNIRRGIEAISANDIWAVGVYNGVEFQPLTEHWDGSGWTMVPNPGPAEWTPLLNGVSAVSSSDVWAVGYIFRDLLRDSVTLTMHWDGTSWSVVPSPNPGSDVRGQNYFFDVTAPATNDAWGVGFWSGPDLGPNQPLVEHWDGSQWNAVAVPGPTGNTRLDAIDSSSSSDMWAVGSYSDDQLIARTLTLHYGEAPIAFTDIAPTDYFYDAVGYLYCRGAVSGYEDNTFRPYNITTRGQLSKITVLAEGWNTDLAGAPHFNDVPTTNPFYAYIETAYNHGIISGYDCGGEGEPCPGRYFRWGNDVTRGQLSRIVVGAEGWATYTTGGPHFNDVLPANPFYTYIETAYNHGIISGYDCGSEGEPCPGLYFRWGNNATRGQISKIVYNAVAQP
jgi:hypothetical protein